MSENQKKKLENLLLDDSFIRFIKEIASEEERFYWLKWEHGDPDHPMLVKHAKELIRFTGYNERRIPDPHIELKKFEGSVKRTSVSTKKNEDKNRFRAGKRKRGYLLTAAAALALVFVSVGIFYSMGTEGELVPTEEEITATSKSDYQTGFGEKAFLNLSDGSRIVLNANSHLTYSWSGSGKTGQNIDVYLQGEAWFDIEPSAEQTARLLRVHTQDGIVEVTGTTFAVQTSDNGTMAVLEEGEIRITRQQPGQSGNANAVLKPGEMAQLQAGVEQIEIRNVNPELYTSWIRGTWTFEQTPLNQIASRIEMVFGVEVEIDPASLNEKTLSGTIGSSNLQLIKEGLSEALQVQVKQIGNKIIIGPA